MNIMSNVIIDTNYFCNVHIKQNENQNKAIKWDLFFNWSSEIPEEIWMCSILNDNIKYLYLNSFCFWFRFNNIYLINGLYLSYYFRSNEWRKLFYSLAQWATRYNLSKTNFLNLDINLPPTFNEQKAIADILSDMDKEISNLKTKRNKYKQIKDWMMQELLTGKIRLV